MNDSVLINADHIYAAIAANTAIRFKYFHYYLKTERVYSRKGEVFVASLLPAARAAGFHFASVTMLANIFATPAINVTERCDRSVRLISALNCELTEP